jgi:hypothetical protein
MSYTGPMTIVGSGTTWAVVLPIPIGDTLVLNTVVASGFSTASEAALYLQ